MDASRLLLAEANADLVLEIAETYDGRGMSLLDLIQYGSLGLLRAAEKFNPDGGYEFGPFASFWVRQAINSAFRKKRMR